MADTGRAGSLVGADGPGGGRAAELAAKRRSATTGAFFAEFVDMFDIYLPTVILTPALAYFQPARMSPGMAGIFTSLIFATTLVGRPIGAAVFGALADRVGRRRSTIASVTGFGVITLLIALVPGHAEIGVASYWLLIVLRFLDGVCLGGGYTGALPLAMEYAPKHKRGLIGGFILAAFALAYVMINLIGLAVFALFPAGGPDSPYLVWGWRGPFVLGALLAFALAWYYVRSVAESEIWEASGSAKQGRLPLLASYVCLFFSYIGAGMLGQRIGRRRTFLILGPLIATVGSGLLWPLVTGTALPIGAVGLLVCVFSILVTAPWGVVLPYINERFHTGVRASGFGLGFSVSVIIPSFYAFYLEGLGTAMPPAVAAVVLLAIGGVLATIGAAAGPETRDVDFAGTEG